MRKLIVFGAIGALALVSCSTPTYRDTGNRIKNFTADTRIMAEPAMKKQKTIEQPVEPSSIKDIKPQPVEKKEPKYKSEPDFVFGNGDKLFIDTKTKMAKVVEPNGTLVVEGEYRKNFPDKQIVIVIDDPMTKFEIGFRNDGFMLLIPKLDTERVISR